MYLKTITTSFLSYVIDNSDISIRTWKDSTIHFKKESVGENYYLFDIHMDEIHTGKYV